MKLRRRDLNLLLVTLVISLGGVAAWLYRLPHLVLNNLLEQTENRKANTPAAGEDTTAHIETSLDTSSFIGTSDMQISSSPIPAPENPPIKAAGGDAAITRFEEADVNAMISGHPFSIEARKIIEGNLDETDSLSRHQILNYCEHLRTSYTTKDIDFLRQFYSDDALIIVGHVVKRDNGNAVKIGYGDKVNYSIHSKRSYLERIARIFAANKAIRVVFSDFKILRHPTIKGIYGVTLRQKYKSDSYADDGYLFLLWDFRNPSMPQIHVRTWQPKNSVNREEDVVDISDFNLE